MLIIQRMFSALQSPPEEITETHINDIFDQLGPIPRLCIDYSSNELEEYKTALYQAISDITAGKIEEMTKSASGLSMDAVSHKICLLSRRQRDDVHSRAVVAPITNSIKSRLSTQLRNLH